MNGSHETRPDGEGPLLERLLRAIATGDRGEVSRLLAASPLLAQASMPIGASRQTAVPFFFQEIGHYVYAGDTALHIAAAAYRVDIAEDLTAHRANPRARNRRGAEPLHYAAVGQPGSANWHPAAQAAIVAYLIGVGANPDAEDKSGVSPLHLAVRTRCAAAVRTLLAHGAQVRRRNGRGSTPLHLAVQNTGRGGTGAAAAREGQAEIIGMLVQHGARPTDRDARGKTVAECIRSAWVDECLRAECAALNG